MPNFLDLSAAGPLGRVLLLVSASAFLASCGGASRAAVSAPTMAGPAQVEAIQHSVFARDPQGQLTEAAIQKLLGSPLELDLPARVGVLPVVPSEDWRGPGPSYEMVPAGLGEFSKKLKSADIFTLVTEMLPIPSGALGMEALREIAARYKLRYIVLYREHIENKTRANPWVVGYATVVGAFFLPGSTLHANGYVEASLFDVKTGLLLFTVRRRVNARQKSNVWHQEDKLANMEQKLALAVAEKLASDTRASVMRFASAVREENERLVGPSRAPAPAAAIKPESVAPANDNQVATQ